MAATITSAPAGWYADPHNPYAARYFDGRQWAPVAAPPRRRSPLCAFILAFCFGMLALPYALPLPGWVRFAISLGLAAVTGWWLLLIIPLTWPFALVLAPLLTVLLNPRD